MNELKPLWERLSDHYNSVFDIQPYQEGMDNDDEKLANNVRLFAGFDLELYLGRQDLPNAVETVKAEARQRIADFNNSAAHPVAKKAFIEMAEETITFLDANPV